MSAAASPPTASPSPDGGAAGRARMAAPKPADADRRTGPAAAGPADPSAARAVVRRMAPRLGLDADSVPLRVVAAGFDSRLGHSPAAATADAVLLRPSALTDADPAMLVHELAHIAQHRNRLRPSASAHRVPAGHAVTRTPDVTAAEAEAAALADAARTGAPLWVPRTALPDGHLARLDGASGVAAVGDPSRTPEQAAAQLIADTAELNGLVASNHIAEIARIRTEIDGSPQLSNATLGVILSLLDTMPFVVARAVLGVGALSGEQRQKLAILDDAQNRNHPRSAVAVFAALTPDDIRALHDRLTTGYDAPLHGVDVTLLDAASLRALYLVLQGQSEQALTRLVGGDRREYFRGLLNSPAPQGNEATDIGTALTIERRMAYVRANSVATPTGTDTDLVARVRTLLSHHNADQAKLALTALSPLTRDVLDERVSPPKTTTPTATSSTTPTGTPATAAHPPSDNAPIRASERVRAVVTQLDTDRLIDVILDNLPSNLRYPAGDSQDYGSVLTVLLAGRAPGFTLPRIESLLSYGIFDWAVTDDDARFAYLLVRSLPLPVQDEWRRRDGAKWFHRLEDNLPDGMVASGEYTGVGTEYRPGGPGAVTDPAILTLLDRILNRWRHDGGPETAADLMTMLAPEDVAQPAASATDTPEQITARKDSAAARETERQNRIAVIRRLDTLGTLDDILWHLTVPYLVSEPGRHAIDRLAAQRDPVRLGEQATRLLSLGVFDWVISAHEAWLAFLLLKALPPAEQALWDHDHPGLWSSMMGAMTPQMRQSTAISALTGRDGWPSLADLHERLADVRLWDGHHNPELRAVILLAYASDDRRWVFELSRRYASLLPQIGPLMVNSLSLYDPAANRTEYVEEQLEVPNAFESLLSVVAEGGRLALYGVGLLFELLWQSHNRTMNETINLQTVQWALGGDVFGAEITDRDHTIVGGTTAEERALRANTNMLEISMDPGRGAFRMRLPQLRLNRLNVSRPGSSYRTGPVTLRNLEVSGSFSDRHYREPVGFDITMDSAEVQDLVIANQAVGALAATEVDLSLVRLRSGATGAEDFAAHPPREGWVGVPVIGPLLQMIDNIVMIWGGLPGDFTLLDFMALALPSVSGAAWLAKEAGNVAANQLIPTPAPGDYIYGLFSDGTLRPPRSVTDRMADAVRMLRSLSVSFSDLDITGLSIGASVQVASVGLHDFSAGGARSRPAYLRLLIDSLRQRIPRLQGAERDAAIARRDAALDELDRFTLSAVRIRELRVLEQAHTLTPAEQIELRWLVSFQDSIVAQRRAARAAVDPDAPMASYAPPTEAEIRMEELERKDRWIAGSLTLAERQELQRLNGLMRTEMGAVLDIGRTEIGAVSGRVEAAGARIGPIHLDARLPDTVVPLPSGEYLADPELIAQFRRGRSRPTAEQLPQVAEVNLTVAGVTLTPSPDGGAILRFPAGTIPSAAALSNQVRSLAANVDPTIRTRLETAAALAARLETAQAQPATTARDIDIQTMQQEIRHQLGIDVGGLTIGPITGSLHAANARHPRAWFGVDVPVDATDIASASFAMDRAHGSLSAGVGLAGLPGTATSTGDWSHWAHGLHPLVGANLTFDNVRTPFGRFDQAAVENLVGTVELIDGGFHVGDLHADAITLEGLNVSTPDKRITGRNVRLEGLDLDVTYRSVDGVVSVSVPRLSITRVVGDNIVYETDNDGTRLHVELLHGIFGDIHATGISYAPSDEGTWITGDVGVNHVDAPYEIVRTVLASGASTRVSGTLAGTATAGTPVLHLGYVQDPQHRVVTFDEAGLVARDTRISTGPDSSMLIQQIPIAAHVVATTDATAAPPSTATPT